MMGKRLIDFEPSDLETLRPSAGLTLPSLFNLFQSAQQTVKAYERFMSSKIPDGKRQKKEIRRKERLKKIYSAYLDSLNITCTNVTANRPAYIQTDTQLKQVISHQTYMLADFHKKYSEPPGKIEGFSHSIYKNPLIFKILALYTKESKYFLPESTNYTVCSIFFHDETLAKKTKASLEKEIAWKISEFRSKNSLKSVISKRKSFDDDYLNAQNGLILDLEKIFQLRKKEKKSDSKGKIGICEFVEGPVRFSLNFNKVLLECERSTRNSHILVGEELTIEVAWSPDKKVVNKSRLGFL